MGFVAPRDVIQVDSLDEHTRVDLWNLVFRMRETMRTDGTLSYEAYETIVTRDLWANHFHKSLSTYGVKNVWDEIQATFGRGNWVSALSMAEGIVKAVRRADKQSDGDFAKVVRDALNELLEFNLVGYRFIKFELVTITSAVEVSSVREALEATSSFAGAHEHLTNALKLLSIDGGNQYGKSFTESISAVEAIVRHFTGAQTLGAGLKLLEKRGFKVHTALSGGWSQLYGYSSQVSGGRHGSIDPSEVTEPLATYFLVACSAFVNLLLKVDSSRQLD